MTSSIVYDRVSACFTSAPSVIIVESRFIFWLLQDLTSVDTHRPAPPSTSHRTLSYGRHPVDHLQESRQSDQFPNDKQGCVDLPPGCRATREKSR